MSNKMKVTIDTKGFKTKFERNCMNSLHAVGENFSDKVKEKVPKDTGNMKESIMYKTNKKSKKVVIGSTSFYAKFQEFGTGIYYEKTGKGRKKPWKVELPDGTSFWTRGNRAQPFMRPAINENTDKVKDIVANALRKDL